MHQTTHRRPNHIPRRCAFTLTELLIAMTASVLLLAVIVEMLFMGIKRWQSQGTYGLGITQATAGLERILKDAQNAVTFATMTVGSNTVYVFSLPANTDAGGSYAPQNLSGTLQYGGGAEVCYYLSDMTGSQSVSGGTVLWRATAPAGTTTWTTDTKWSLVNTNTARCPNISALSLAYTGSNYNEVQISVTATTTEGKFSRPYTATRLAYMPYAPAPGTGLVGQYCNDQGDSNYFTALVLTRVDPTVNFTWNGASPGTGVQTTNFSVRWSGKVMAPLTGSYTFTTYADDGVRLWVNGTQVINDWSPHAPLYNNTSTITLTAGVQYDIKLEYFQSVAGDLITFYWTPPGQSRQIIPMNYLYPAASSVTATGTISGLYNTGINNSGGTTTGGSTDLHYTLPAGPVIGTPYVGSPYVWFANTSTSQWLTPHSDGSTSESVATFTYRTTFTVSNTTNLVGLTGQVAADDTITDMRLNGTSVKQNFAGYSGWTSFSIVSNFVVGTNTLDFDVKNSGGVSGFRVELTPHP